MIRWRSLDSPGELCCLPSPHRVPRGVAGMAFNFSEVKFAEEAGPRDADAIANPVEERVANNPLRAKSLLACFDFPRLVPAT